MSCIVCHKVDSGERNLEVGGALHSHIRCLAQLVTSCLVTDKNNCPLC